MDEARLLLRVRQALPGARVALRLRKAVARLRGHIDVSQLETLMGCIRGTRGVERIVCQLTFFSGPTCSDVANDGAA